MVIRECWPAIPFRRITKCEPNVSILWEKCKVEIPHLRSCIVAMLAGNRIRGNAKLSGREDPVWIRKVVYESKVLEAAVISVEAVPLRFLHVDSHGAARITTPAG